ncbi:MAG TPA: hypothetical protein VK489_03805 [Ferruginibacter sp.]|nr:hypothetical protein [Ferruginibacter sp.]
MEAPVQNGNTFAGTVGGTMLVVLLKINIEELQTTAVLAAVGATVSFGTSMIFKYIVKRYNRK